MVYSLCLINIVSNTNLTLSIQYVYELFFTSLISFPRLAGANIKPFFYSYNTF